MIKFKEILKTLGYINIFFLIFGFITSIVIQNSFIGPYFILFSALFILNNMSNYKINKLFISINECYDYLDRCLDREGKYIEILKELNEENTKLEERIKELETKEVKED